MGLDLVPRSPLELRPDAGEREQRAVIVEGEPHHVLLLGFRARWGTMPGLRFWSSRLVSSSFCSEMIQLDPARRRRIFPEW
jgi:hypothetical protein